MFHTWLAFLANASENGVADWPLEGANLDAILDECFTHGFQCLRDAPQNGKCRPSNLTNVSKMASKFNECSAKWLRRLSNSTNVSHLALHF